MDGKHERKDRVPRTTRPAMTAFIAETCPRGILTRCHKSVRRVALPPTRALDGVHDRVDYLT